MYRAFTYLYYRIYAWNVRTWGESDVPQFNALFGVSFLVFLNILSVLAAIDVSVGRHIVSLPRPVEMGWHYAQTFCRRNASTKQKKVPHLLSVCCVDLRNLFLAR